MYRAPLVGILGGGQLGRMLVLAGYPMGIRFRVLDPDPAAPAGQVAEQLVGRYDDAAIIRQLITGADVVTYEFENVPVGTVQMLEGMCPVYPPPIALATAQDRLVEKQFFRGLGIPTPAFVPVDDRAMFDAALSLAGFGLPAVLKTRRMGYDGKGQVVIQHHDDAERAWEQLGGVPLILEQFIPFEREFSLLAVRGRDGEQKFSSLIENVHRDGILRWSRVPSPHASAALQAEAEGYATRILEALEYVGVLAVEFFHYAGGLLASEMAPRVHNSGHWSIEGAKTSQFANHLRAILGWPLGDLTPTGCWEMENIIGDIPDITTILADSWAYLHLYGKTPRPGRKLGHITRRIPS